MLAICKAPGFTPVSVKNILSVLPSPLAEVQRPPSCTPFFCKREKIFLDTLKSLRQAGASLSTAEERWLHTLRWVQTSRWPQNGAWPLATLSWEI